ncbi:MAG: complex I subunit 5 family protein [bacterium]
MNYNSAILLIVAPLLMAFLSLPIGMFNKRVPALLLVLTNAFCFFFSTYLLTIVALKGPLVSVISGFEPPFGINLVLTYTSLLLLSLIYLIILAASVVFVSKKTDENTVKVSSLLFLFTASASGLLLTGDIFNMFVFFEIFAVANISLITLNKNKSSLKGAFKYLLLSSIGSAFFLFAIGMIYGTLGTLNIAEIGLRFHELSPLTGSFIFIMFLGAILSETETFPFNFWITDSYGGARNFVNILLGSASSVAALYVFFRIFLTIIGYPINNRYEFLVSVDGRTIVAFISAFSIIASEVAALSSKNVKRVLALSSASQMGMILFAFSISDFNSLSAALVLILNLSLSKAILFLSSHEIMKGNKEKNIDSLSGGLKRSPLFSILFIFAALSMVGFPLTLGFYGKTALIASAVSTSNYFVILISIVLLASVAELFYYFRMMHKLFVFRQTDVNEKPRFNLFYATSGILLVAVMVLLIVLPKFTERIVSSAAKDMMDKTTYMERVLKAGDLK